ncbi:MAG: Rossmann-like domain-containing protein [Candidatus Bipolaricaulia bacterium]
MIIEDLLRSVEGALLQRRVEDIRVGLGYTAVRLDDGSCGLAATMRDEISACCTLLERAGTLSDQRADSLAELALSPDSLEATLGVATINAILGSRALEGESTESEIVRDLAITERDSVGMIGYFGPLIGPIRKSCRELYIFERRLPAFEAALGEAPRVYPDWAVELLLPKCDVVLISGTTVVNKTLDHLLALCRGRVALVGPTTPLSEIFAKYGVSFLFGSRVRDPERVLKIVSEGGGTTTFGSAVSKVTVRLRR